MLLDRDRGDKPIGPISPLYGINMTRLQNGDRFPHLTIDTVANGRLSLPDYMHGHYGVVLFYRGSWCPYCNAQLAAFVRSQAQLTELDIKVVALSVDDEATTKQTVEKRQMAFPMGYGADAHALAELTGAYINPDPLYLESTGFVLDPSGRLITVVYSSNAIGRLLPDDVVGFIKYKKQAA
jgi:peroxiredoxin